MTPAALSGSSTTATTPGVGSSPSRTARNDGGKDFGQLLQGGASTPPADNTAPTGVAATGSDDAASVRPSASEQVASEAAAPPAAKGATDQDATTETDEAPWPPFGLAGLVLAAPLPADPAASVPPSAAGTAPSALAATAVPPSPVAASPAAAVQPAAPGVDGEDGALPLPALPMGDAALERSADSDSTLQGDRAPPAPLQAPLPAALQDLKAALSSNAVFNGEPTPKPVLGDDGFDQAIGARLGWLADQKIGHAHIRLSPDDLGPVDVRLQLNGDKVHASFSSPHVDVRQALESSLPRLRELLGEQGFQLAHADVGHQSGGGGAPAGQAGQEAGRGDGEPTRGDASLPALPLIRQRGLLDAYA
ncbi:flagellar hook-length control protein FliK [Stenotrophomonas maltophilia]|uniref:flagellar hook-length control protein FliK n=1 Tax=Stenotrophomonas maltophilia TaxID=40324 RepID=UPI0028951E2B|nr:flagellar hook-length control protein FliK [Stenotrophomonas maltophilia]MDT3499376.1 flagellar hook-length control protein FliK [Stenotrophomonas maltophilia]